MGKIPEKGTRLRRNGEGGGEDNKTGDKKRKTGKEDEKATHQKKGKKSENEERKRVSQQNLTRATARVFDWRLRERPLSRSLTRTSIYKESIIAPWSPTSPYVRRSDGGASADSPSKETGLTVALSVKQRTAVRVRQRKKKERNRTCPSVFERE